ncbi:hypothetical protein MLD38_031363 [Melastoma candidum]|uniref:Uncharacterized protein n=1 Tax=Melastoma candidum TaxID=119954 RepID=A0ACB9MP25_9MYRT|nr:hypothetical protein MLD38_031363 [Melastoma candidum]
MESTSMLVAVVAAAVSVLTVTCLWMTAEWVWLKPKRAERLLRRQGFVGNPYRLLSGDLKETGRMLVQASSRPIGLDDEILPRIVPFVHRTIKNYGKDVLFYVIIVVVIVLPTRKMVWKLWWQGRIHSRG